MVGLRLLKQVLSFVDFLKASDIKLGPVLWLLLPAFLSFSLDFVFL